MQLQRGFTLTELVIALLITAMVTSGALAFLSVQQRAVITNSRTVDLQEDARLALELLVADGRMAGFLVPAMASLASVDGGTSNSDMFCVSDPSVIAEASITGAVQPFDRAVVTAALGDGENSATLRAATMDIDADGTSDFAVGRGVIISDGNDTHCARLTSVNTTTGAIGFTPATPSGFAASAITARAVPAIVYEQSGLQLLRNNVMLSDQVEDLQVEFAVDLDADGDIEADDGEFPINDLNGNSSTLTRGVQLSVLTRAIQADETRPGLERHQVGNRAAASEDGFVRRRYVLTIAPRNLQ